MQTERWGSSYWFAGLLLVWAGLLFGGFLFGAPDTTGSQRIPTWARMASSLSLVVAGWAWYGHAGNSSGSPFSLLIAIGMTLGLVGDLFMADLLAVEPHVLAGMASFAAGHIAYIAAMIYLGNRAGLAATKPLRAPGWPGSPSDWRVGISSCSRAASPRLSAGRPWVTCFCWRARQAWRPVWPCTRRSCCPWRAGQRSSSSAT